MKFIKILILSVALLQVSCKKDDLFNCLKGSGATITEVREITPFYHLELWDNIDVIFTPDSVFSIKVTCGKNIIDGITTEVIEERLHIKNINKCNWLRDFRNKFTVEVSGNNLRQIIARGSGNIIFTDTLTTKYFLIESWEATGKADIILNSEVIESIIKTGPIDIYLTGITNSFTSFSSGNGYIFARNLQSEYNYSSNNGTGDFHFMVNKELVVNINHSGDIYYSGDPYNIEKTTTSTGNLYKR